MWVANRTHLRSKSDEEVKTYLLASLYKLEGHMVIIPNGLLPVPAGGSYWPLVKELANVTQYEALLVVDDGAFVRAIVYRAQPSREAIEQTEYLIYDEEPASGWYFKNLRKNTLHYLEQRALEQGGLP